MFVDGQQPLFHTQIHPRRNVGPKPRIGQTARCWTARGTIGTEGLMSVTTSGGSGAERRLHDYPVCMDSRNYPARHMSGQRGGRGAAGGDEHDLF